MVEVTNDSLGAMGYFPWATQSPRIDWVSGDNRAYVNGTYPDADSVYQAQNIDYLVNNRSLTSNNETDGWKPFSSSEAAGGGVFSTWRAFQLETIAISDYCWLSGRLPTDSNPEYIGLIMGGKQHRVSKVRLYPRAGYPAALPKKVMLKGTTDGVEWSNILDETTQPDADGVISIPEEKQTLISGIRMDIYSIAGSAPWIGLSGMLIYAKGIRSPEITKDMGGTRVAPGMSEWCLRVGEGAASRMMQVSYRT